MRLRKRPFCLCIVNVHGIMYLESKPLASVHVHGELSISINISILDCTRAPCQAMIA